MAIKVGVVLFFVGLLGTLAFGQARTPYTRPAYVTTPGSISTSASGDQFVCTATNAVCEVESSIDATTMTSTVPAFDIGPTATPGANDKLACFSYGATGSKTRVACVDTEGDINGRVFQSTALSAGTGFACTNLGCRLSLGSTSGYLVQDGAGQYSFANAGLAATYFTTNGTYQTNSGASATLNGVVTDGATAVATILRSNGTLATAGAKITSFRNGSSELGFIDYLGNLSANSFVSTTASGSTLTGGGASGPLLITSNTPDSHTSTTVAAITMQASQDIGASDQILLIKDHLGNNVFRVAEGGTVYATNQIESASQFQTTFGTYVGGSSSTIMTLSSAATDAVTSGTVPAIKLQASQNIADTDLLMSVEDSAGNRRMTLTEVGNAVFAQGVQAVGGSLIASAGLTNNLYLERTPNSITIADSGGAGAAAYTWAPGSDRNITHFTCNDADGCNVTMSETGAGNGFQNRAINISANTINFTDTAGVSELAGNFAMGQYDVLDLHYAVNTYVEVSRSDN